MTTSTAPAQPKSYFESDAEVLRPMIASADRVGLAELGRLVDIRAFMEDDLTTLEKDIGETWTELKTVQTSRPAYLSACQGNVFDHYAFCYRRG